MEFQFNIFSLTLIISGIITATLSVLISRKKGNVLKWFGLLIASISWWAHTYGLELASTTLSQMLFFIKLEYLAISTLPAFWIIFVIYYVGKSSWLDKKMLTAIFIIPVLTIILVWTNQQHFLHYSEVGIDDSGEFPLLDITPGIWYQINTIYFYILLALGLYLLLARFKKADAIFKRQNLTLIAGALFPWLVNLLYLLDLRPFGHIDLTPYAFSITAFCIAYGILRFRLFEILPVARDKVLEVMQDGVLVLDRKDRVIFINAIMKKVLDFPEMSMSGTEIEFLFPKDDKLLTAIKGRIQTAVELKWENGEDVKIYEVLLTPIHERNKFYSGQLLLFRDITSSKLYGEKLQAQTEELMALNELKDKLFSIIAHDLQGPMGSLKDLLLMVDTGEVTEKEVKRLIPHISKYVSNISDLMENLLQWSRSQISGVKINKEKFELNGIISDTINLFEKRITEKQLEVTENVNERVIVYGDKDMLKFIFRNLLANAIKFCNPGDKILVNSEINGGFTILSVVDTGIGIQEENLHRLFGLETFSTKGTKSEKGTGLGLLLCREFIEKNGGKIWVESEWGKGSTFSITIPNAKEEPALSDNK